MSRHMRIRLQITERRKAEPAAPSPSSKQNTNQPNSVQALGHMPVQNQC